MFDFIGPVINWFGSLFGVLRLILFYCISFHTSIIGVVHLSILRLIGNRTNVLSEFEIEKS